jgi:hypothetical protein
MVHPVCPYKQKQFSNTVCVYWWNKTKFVCMCLFKNRNKNFIQDKDVISSRCHFMFFILTFLYCFANSVFF